MRLRLGELEEALRNPEAFARQQPRHRIRRPTRYLALRNAALGFHGTNDLDGAVTVLEARLQTFKTTKGNDLYVEKLREYVTNFEALGTTVARVRNNLRFPVPVEYLDFQVTGQVSRLDIHPAGGYRAWLLANKAESWNDQLRFPLIQIACAKQLAANIDEVVPGVYDFSTGTYTELQLDNRTIQRAQRRLLALLEELRRILS